MKLRNLLLAVAFTAIGSTSFAFNVSFEMGFPNEIPAKYKGTEKEQQFNIVKNYFKSAEKYDVNFESNRRFMSIKCPYDGGISIYFVKGQYPILVKSTDTCEHKLLLKTEQIDFYQDYVPFLIAEDYCKWRTSKDTDSAAANTWARYGERTNNK